jgi:penicillin-binding protein 2
MIGAIKHSCNCYLYTVGRLIGADAILDMAARFGFGEKTGIDLIGELSGFIPTRKWKKAKLRYGWQLGDTINTSIGQGYTLTTPLQLACMAAAIASGGNIYRPNLLLGKPAELIRQVNIAPEHLAVIQQGMFQASNTPGGTGYMSRVFDEDYKIAVKTGTSQVMSKRDDSHDLSAKSTSWLHKNHALCIGYGPFKAPRFAVATIVDHGGSGSSTGAPIVRDVLHGLMKKYC